MGHVNKAPPPQERGLSDGGALTPPLLQRSNLWMCPKPHTHSELVLMFRFYPVALRRGDLIFIIPSAVC